jgi:hypothetical protein
MRTKEEVKKSWWEKGFPALVACLPVVFVLLVSQAFAEPSNTPAEPASRTDAKTLAVDAGQKNGTTTQPATEGQAATSTDFMMGAAPLVASSTEAVTTPEAPVQVPVPDIEAAAFPLTADMVTSVPPSLLDAAAQQPNDIAMLLNESCSGADGSRACSQAYSNGHHASVVTQKMSEGDEFRVQTVVEEYDQDNELVSKKTIRRRVDFNYYQNEKGMEKEMIDIVREEAGKKTTRELMTRQYYLDTKKTKSVTWAQYEQVGDTETAALVYKADLHYSSRGTPLRGVAERWDLGEKTASFLNWNASRHGNLALDKEAWEEWEAWMKSVPLHASLPIA